jgi:hypothetical protein
MVLVAAIVFGSAGAKEIYRQDNRGVTYSGAAVTLDSALTRDSNGNGYIDRIEIYWNSEITLPVNYSAGNLTIVSDGTVFQVDSIVPRRVANRKLIVFIREDSSRKVFQTSLKPLISITGIPSASDVASFQTKDGAGPIIQSVVKYIFSPENRKSDVFRITFSEPIQGPGGKPFAPAQVKPEDVFMVLRMINNPAYVDTLTSALYNISSFTKAVDDSMLEFEMTNGYDLTTDNYFVIRASPGEIYGFPEGASPSAINTPVRVDVITQAAPSHIYVVSSPSRPTCKREAPGVFRAVNNPQGRTWVRQDAAGVVITFQTVTTAINSSIEVEIFDSFGASVASNKSAGIDYLGNIAPFSRSAINIDIYWNGTDPNGNYVHEGAYVAQLKYFPPDTKDPIVLQDAFYLEKPEDGHSLCGGGYSVALLPLVGISLRRVLRKKKAKRSEGRPQ